MQRRPIIGITALVIVFAIAGCGGGSGSPTPSLPQPGATPISTGPSSGGGSGSGSQSNARTTATFSVAISGAAQAAVAREQSYRASHGGRTPMFVSPGTQGITITATPSGGAATTYTYDVSSGSALCVVTGGTRNCTMKVTINPGTYAFTMTLYDAAPVSGVIPAGAHALGTSTLGSVTIVEGQNNAVAFSVEGIVAGAALSGGSSFISLPGNGTPHSAGLALVVTDASGAPISGTYASPIAVSLTESGGSGHTQLVLNGTPVGTSATLTSSSDTLGLSYDGGGAPGYTTATSFAGVTGSIRMSPLYVSGPLTFTDQAQTKSITIAEANSPFTTPPAVAWSCAGFSPSTTGTNASASYSVTSPSLTYDAAVPSFACPGTVTITDALGTSITTAESGSLPTVSECASTGGVTNLYLGAQSGGQYEVSSGVPCPLQPTATSITIYAPPNDGSHPGTLADAISEQNDTTAASVTATTCAGIATPSPALTPGPTLSNPLGGNVSVTSVPTQVAGTQTCTVTVNDNNFQSPKSINVTVIPTVQTINSTVSTTTGSTSCSTTVVGGQTTYRCHQTATEDIGTSAGNGATYSFANSTNAIAVNLNVASSGVGVALLELYETSPTPYSWTLTGSASGSTETLNTSYALPSAGTYGLRVSVTSLCQLTGSPCTPPGESMTITGYITEAGNGTGVTTP